MAWRSPSYLPSYSKRLGLRAKKVVTLALTFARLKFPANRFTDHSYEAARVELSQCRHAYRSCVEA